MAYWRDTPGHSYLVLSREENDQIPAWLRMDEYEEDCDWAIAVVAVPSILATVAFRDVKDKSHLLNTAHKTFKTWHPDEYTRLTGTPVSPEESPVLRERIFNAEHANDWVVVSAVGDWHEDCPKGFVFCTAKLGGRNEKGRSIKMFLVQEERYAFGTPPHEFGYVIQPDDQEFKPEDIHV